MRADGQDDEGLGPEWAAGAFELDDLGRLVRNRGATAGDAEGSDGEEGEHAGDDADGGHNAGKQCQLQTLLLSARDFCRLH
jgi:hypothetical protein